MPSKTESIWPIKKNILEEVKVDLVLWDMLRWTKGAFLGNWMYVPDVCMNKDRCTCGLKNKQQLSLLSGLGGMAQAIGSDNTKKSVKLY